MRPITADDIVAKVRAMTREQENAKTCTASPVTLFQRAVRQFRAVPEGMFPGPDGELHIHDERFVPEAILEKVDEAMIAGEIEERSHFALLVRDAEGLKHDDGGDLVLVDWHTEYVFGSVEEAREFGRRYHYRYGRGIEHVDWRVYTVPAMGALGEIVKWGILEAIKEARGAKEEPTDDE